jgi:8-oxo-dGTP pyrophosphatase MutT (NUDIX family)
MTVTPVARVGARVLLLDPRRRVLLIHERIEGGVHWITPGGGVEPGESLPEAAAREVYEETSIHVVLDPERPAVHVTRRDWQWAGTSYDQTDHFFLAELAEQPTVVPSGLTPMETQTLLGHRWWSIEELRETTEDVVPAELADILERILPAQPTSAAPTA